MRNYPKAWSNVASLAMTSDYYKPNKDDLDIEAIQELVDKATPKKPTFDDTYVYSSGLCPNCNSHRIINHESYEKLIRCSDCGQLLDWSKDE